MPIRSDLPGPQGTLLTPGYLYARPCFWSPTPDMPVRTTAAAVTSGGRISPCPTRHSWRSLLLLLRQRFHSGPHTKGQDGRERLHAGANTAEVCASSGPTQPHCSCVEPLIWQAAGQAVGIVKTISMACSCAGNQHIGDETNHIKASALGWHFKIATKVRQPLWN